MLPRKHGTVFAFQANAFLVKIPLPKRNTQYFHQINWQCKNIDKVISLAWHIYCISMLRLETDYKCIFRDVIIQHINWWLKYVGTWLWTITVLIEKMWYIIVLIEHQVTFCCYHWNIVTYIYWNWNRLTHCW